MKTPDLTPDCTNCQALCCVLLPFDEGPTFAFDKPAGRACHHLGPGHRCQIHGQLAKRGFSGCRDYSCLGAGQRTIALLCKDATWRADPVRLAEVEDFFRLLRQVHEALQLLQTVGGMDLPEAAEAGRLALLARLDAGRDWTAESLAEAASRGGVLEAVREYLAGLRGVIG